MIRRSTALLIALVAACDQGARGAHPAGPAGHVLLPAPTPAGLPSAAGTTTEVGAEGGPVAAPDGRLEVAVPPEALGTTVALTVTPIASMARGAIGPAYRLGPDGTTFAVPVTLTFRAPAPFPPGTSLDGVGIAYQDALGYWHQAGPVTRDAAANTVSVRIDHFSDWALTWTGGTPAAEGTILLSQSVPVELSGTGELVPVTFTALATAATLHFLSDDPSDTSYALTGSLQIQEPVLAVGGLTCVPDPPARTLPVNVAEVHKSTPPVFRFGIGGHWALRCSDGSTPLLPAVFDTLGINAPRCPGDYTAGQIVAADRLSGGYAKDCSGSVGGTVSASWDLRTCWSGRPCLTGVECRDGSTVCVAGVQSCVDAGPTLDPVPCGTTGWACAGGACVPP